MATAEVAENTAKTTYRDVVGFYEQVCTAVEPVVQVPDGLSRVVEDTIGTVPGEAFSARRDVLAGAVEETRAAAGRLRGVHAPVRVGSVRDARGVDYAPARDAAAEAVDQAARRLGDDMPAAQVVDAAVDGDRSRVLSEVTGELTRLAGELSGEANRVLGGVFDAAPVPNQVTMDVIRSLPACAALMGTGGVDPEVVSIPAVQLWEIFDQATDGPGSIAEALEGFGDLADQQFTEAGGAAGAVADRFDSVAAAARRFAGDVRRWDGHRANTPDGYVEAANQLAGEVDRLGQSAAGQAAVYRDIATGGDVARFDDVSRGLSGQVTDLADEVQRISVRFTRNAPVPNQATSEAIDQVRNTRAGDHGPGETDR
ncbi:hypothetical protein [Corynebacterium bovis]|uniref:hypothetical protein n=1 Tax=Corynebacterium bovis TaxID=36808 RepID=UPI000F6312D1|nr:hypothetical protein [Corynebacterium bovis]RRO98688.1 hypothetical protein CXF32_00090 [Corynebacterium bovis]RRQ00676.1 hypothetical protein CXF31_00105 [Corynebacterium bovis]RRQ06461.1 hypothetical protein CXF43_08515 [Corynebacterium bovis]RRQ09558.1 hypothetical protein CXF44_07965 [Corynebacterium bovis]